MKLRRMLVGNCGATGKNADGVITLYFERKSCVSPLVLGLVALCASAVAMASESGAFELVDSSQRDPDSYFVNDLSGALSYCDEESLRNAFHEQLRWRKYGKSWKDMATSERVAHNQFIYFATGVGRGLDLAGLDSAAKARICRQAVKSAKSIINGSVVP